MDTDYETKKPSAGKARELLLSYIKKPNITDIIDQEKRLKIGQEVSNGFDIDKSSRADWEKKTKSSMDLALQTVEKKTFPWAGAANVKYPLITSAAIQFSARSYPAIIAGPNVVKGEVFGSDPDGEKKARADRVGSHMSYQILEKMQNWDEEVDSLLMQVAIIGCAFRKTYYSSTLGIPCSDLISANDVVFDNGTPWAKLRRITHCINLFENDVVERIRSGIFSEVELTNPLSDSGDSDAPYEFLEQHCWYDLDGDGYKEPYIVTIKKDTAEVVRITARFDETGIRINEKNEIVKIVPIDYWTKFSFMPNPDGGSYDVGLWMLLTPINETVNSILNQMLDAGTLSNTGGGFIGSSLRIGRSRVSFTPGEYKPVDFSGGRISDHIHQISHTGPNQVLFQLLGMLIDAGKDISSVKDILSGEQQTAQTATTTLALIEQGQKVFSAIYKRIHRSLKLEFKKIYRLNSIYLDEDEYFRFQDSVIKISIEDYKGDGSDIAPVSDPTLISDAQVLTQADALLKFIGDPLFDQMEIRKRWLRAIKAPNPEALLIMQGSPEEQLLQLQQQAAQMHEQMQVVGQENQDLKLNAAVSMRKVEVEREIAMTKIEVERERVRLANESSTEQANTNAQITIAKSADELELKRTIAAEEAILNLDETMKAVKFMFAQHEKEMEFLLDKATMDVDENNGKGESADNSEQDDDKQGKIALMMEKHQELVGTVTKLLSDLEEKKARVQTMTMKAPSGAVYTGTVTSDNQ